VTHSVSQPTPKVGDRYRQGDYMWEIFEVSDERVKARRAGRLFTVEQSLDDPFPYPSKAGKSVSDKDINSD
jgi:hypothetical protein